MPYWYTVQCYVQVKAMCSLPCGGVPTTYLNSQQTKEQRSAVLKELNKVCTAGCRTCLNHTRNA